MVHKSEKKTFAELGIPFQLHSAPINPGGEYDYVGPGTCTLCGRHPQPCFRLGVGDRIVITCPNCGALNGVRFGEKKAVVCQNCSANLESTTWADAREVTVCYECLRAGKVALTKDTEFGMVSWDQAVNGITNGVPGLSQSQFEPVVVSEEDNWVGARLPQEIMFELLRTPNYSTWQGERWLFCCRYPMTFVGEWDREDFRRHDPNGEGEALYYQVARGAPANSWKAVGTGVCVHVFNCKRCGKLRAHFDFD
jgi:uncharacterized protein CbrC (UPF0167 family)